MPQLIPKKFTIRPMQIGDVPEAMKLSTAEGWNQTEKDWKLFIRDPANTCLVAECENKVVGTTTAINYSHRIAWIAMVLVDKEYRGNGISKSLLQNAIEKLHTCESLKLDATAAGQQVYKKLEFRDEYAIARMTNVALNEFALEHRGTIPEPIQITDLSEVMDLDEIVFGARRAQLIENLVKEYPGKSWMIKRNATIAAIALGRDGNRYHHIGPVLASDTLDAKMLIGTALKKLINQPVVVDVLCDKSSLVDWLSTIGFTQQRKFIRMYKNHNPYPGLVDRQFLICGPEFG